MQVFSRYRRTAVFYNSELKLCLPSTLKSFFQATTVVMASIDQIIRREINPLIRQHLNLGTFGRSSKIHCSMLIRFITRRSQESKWFSIKPKDHRTRTLIHGDSGSGKSHLLVGSNKPQSQSLLPTLVLGLIATLFGGTSYAKPLIACYMFLKNDKNLSCCSGSGLPAFRERGFKKWVLGERAIFIRNLRRQVASTMPKVFGVLYDLTNPELYP